MGNGKFALILALLVSVGVAAWPSATQRNVARGVAVAVTPGTLDPANGIWDFAVAFDSRGPRLADELMDSIVLVGDDGRQARPLAWEGAGPGGTHRAGVLKFMALKPRPQQLELRVQRPGEPAPRVFRFVFGGWSA